MDAVERQVEYVRTALRGVQFAHPVEIRGALCFPNPDGLPLVAGLKVREVLIDGPKAIAKFARRPGSLDSEAIRELWEHLAQALDIAARERQLAERHLGWNRSLLYGGFGSCRSGARSSGCRETSHGFAMADLPVYDHTAAERHFERTREHVG